jgi:ubiquinone/menaquinone biosynthesis C-methylase UbiE
VDLALADGSDARGGLGPAMTGVWIALGVVALAGLIALAYWQLIVAEGTYLGPRTVAWTYDLVASRYDAIKRFEPQNERWFLAGPLLRDLEGLEYPLVLDVATGTGRLPLALLRERFRGRIIGLDLSLGMLRHARRKLRAYGDQVRWVWQDASHLPFDDEMFDAVTCLESAEFMPRPSEVLSEMLRVLAPGGTLMLTNRVGREARLLPGRVISRPAFEELLATHSLTAIEVRRWQADYDLATAQKSGQRLPKTGKGVDVALLVRCPACGGSLQHTATGLSCLACTRTYPIREGIACLADWDR